MKKLLIIALALMLILGIASCAKPNAAKELIGDWMLTGDAESPYGVFLSFTATTAAYGFSVELEEGEELIDHLHMFKFIAKLLEISYSIEDGFIILHEAHLNNIENEETGENIPGEDAHVAYSLEGSTLVFGGYTYVRLVNGTPVEP